MSDKIKAPFTDDQVRHLNAWQESGVTHEFTCGGTHEFVIPADPETGDPEFLTAHSLPLLATNAGWVCSGGCDYTQDWAHDFMADPEYLAQIRASLNFILRS